MNDSPHDPASNDATPELEPHLTRVYEPQDLERPASATPTETELEEQTPVSVHLEDRDPYAALRHRDYRLYAIGGLLETIGNQMQNVAVGWEVFERTKDPLALGIVGLIQAIPVICFALPAGQMADRFDRRRVVLLMQVLLILSWSGLAVLSYQKGPLLFLYGLLLIDGIAHAFSGPARSALLPQLVPPELLPNAVTWNSSRWQIASLIGPALGGFAIAYFGRAAPVYAIAAVGALIMFFFLLPLRPRPQERSGDAMSWQSLLVGVRFVFGTKLLLATLTLDMFAVLFGGAVALLPIFASEQYLNVGPEGLGWLRAAPAFGAFVMAMSIAHLPPMRRAGKALLWAVIGFGAATIVFGLSRNFYLSLLMLALTGAFDNISVVVRHTLVQVLTPDHMRGRVSAVNSVFIGTSNEIGSFESGVVAKLIGTTAAVVAGGVGTILVVLGVAKQWPEVMRLGSLQETIEEADAL